MRVGIVSDRMRCVHSFSDVHYVLRRFEVVLQCLRVFAKLEKSSVMKGAISLLV